MTRRRPLTKEQLAEIQEAARRGPDGKPLAETMGTMIEGTATAPEAACASEKAGVQGQRELFGFERRTRRGH